MRLLGAILLAALLRAQPYDLVIAHGRVLDPASNLDALRNIGIRAGKIAAISPEPLMGRATIDASGLTVTPGFIDLHSHGQTPENYRFKARDGVTTALEMEVGVSPVPDWYRARDGKALINFGATAGHLPARMAVMHDTGKLLPRDGAVTRAATPEERREILALVRHGLDEGALGIGLGIAYIPLVTREEILDLFQLAAERKTAVYVHMRNGGPVEPGVIDALQEVIADAAATGASLHVVHITSMGLRETPLCLKMIEGARRRGLDVTTEAYPYTAGMTDIGSAIFAPGWQQRQGSISFGDLQWAATGERLTAESFARYRQQGGMVAVHSIPEDIVRLAMADPMVMIASDGILENGKGHPRAAGTFCRVLGRYVREEHALTLMDAVRKMTVMPADRLGIKTKGRIAVGADADLDAFDPATVIDHATFQNPAQYSTGMKYVLVNGTEVVRNGELVDGVAPGEEVRRPFPNADARAETRARIQSTLFVPDPLPPLQSETYGTFQPAPGVIAERVSYATAYGLRVPAIVYRPDPMPAGKVPGMVVVNGHGGDKYSWYAFYAGILYARAGAVVVTYDPIGEGERNSERKSGTRQHDHYIDPPEMGRRMGGLMIADTMQAVSWLQADPRVDSRRLAAVGYSMGSFVLGLACAVDTRLNSCVLAGGGNLDGDGGYWDSSDKKMCQAIPYQSLKFLGDRGAVLYDLHAARGATYIINGTLDTVVKNEGPEFFEDLRRRTIALHGSAQNVFEYLFVPGSGHRPQFVTRAAALWLERHLDFPNWTAESIGRMGETHISEWAARNHVPMDPMYATELREGGTPALGTDIPGIPHDMLNALPRDKWERDKSAYIYESWVKAAKALVRQ
jgi:N-acyl-D-aspartate/D-glutamate deacylase/dienelactone hydrolase